MIEDIIESANMKLSGAIQNNEFPRLISIEKVSKLLRDTSQKKVPPSTIELLNLIFYGLVEDIGKNCAYRKHKKITIDDVNEILRLRSSINITIGSLHIKKIQQRGDIQTVKNMINVRIRRLSAAMKKKVELKEMSQQTVDSILDDYELMNEEDNKENNNDIDWDTFNEE